MHACSHPARQNEILTLKPGRPNLVKMKNDCPIQSTGPTLLSRVNTQRDCYGKLVHQSVRPSVCPMPVLV